MRSVGEGAGVIGRWAVAVAVCGGVVWASGAGARVCAGERVVKGGETYLTLAREAYGDQRYWKRLAYVNARSERAYPQDGDVLFVPDRGDAASPAGTLEGVRGGVTAVPVWGGRVEDGASEEALAEGAKVLWSRKVTVAKGGEATVRLATGGSVVLREGCVVSFLGARDRARGGVTRVELEEGRMEFVGPVGARAPKVLEAVTRDGVASLRGGSVMLEAQLGKYVYAVGRGGLEFGQIQAREGVWGEGHPRLKMKAKPLPEPVALRVEQEGEAIGEAGRAALALSLGDASGGIGLSWGAMELVSRYELRVEQRGGGVVEARTLGADVRTHQVRLPQSGVYAVRMRAFNMRGIPGAWGSVPVVYAKAKADLRYRGRGRFVGEVALEAEVDPKEGLMARWGREGAPVLLGARPLPAQGVGEHVLYVEDGRGVVASRRLSVEAVPGVEVTWSPRKLDPLAREPFEVKVRLRDGAGRPVLGGAPEVVLGGRGCRAQARGGAGEYVCAFVPRVAPGLTEIELVVRGGGFRQVTSVPVVVPEPELLPTRRPPKTQ